MDEKFFKALRDIGRELNKMNSLPKLKYPELTNDHNDVNWLYFGIEEIDDKIYDSKTAECVKYWVGRRKEYVSKIKRFSHILN